jgi:4-hydroxybenzoate polyprenyltransferase
MHRRDGDNAILLRARRVSTRRVHARNLLNALGYSFFFAGALQVFLLVGNNSALDHGAERDVYEGKPLVWLVVVCALIFTTIHAQDFGDEEGDRARGRKTVQTALGDAASRWVVVVGAGVWSVVVSAVLELGWVVMSVLFALAGCLARGLCCCACGRGLWREMYGRIRLGLLGLLQ